MKHLITLSFCYLLIAQTNAQVNQEEIKAKTKSKFSVTLNAGLGFDIFYFLRYSENNDIQNTSLFMSHLNPSLELSYHANEMIKLGAEVRKTFFLGSFIGTKPSSYTDSSFSGSSLSMILNAEISLMNSEKFNLFVLGNIGAFIPKNFIGTDYNSGITYNGGLGLTYKINQSNQLIIKQSIGVISFKSIYDSAPANHNIITTDLTLGYRLYL